MYITALPYEFLQVVFDWNVKITWWENAIKLSKTKHLLAVMLAWAIVHCMGAGNVVFQISKIILMVLWTSRRQISQNHLEWSQVLLGSCRETCRVLWYQQAEEFAVALHPLLLPCMLPRSALPLQGCWQKMLISCYVFSFPYIQACLFGNLIFTCSSNWPHISFFSP